MGEQQPSTNAGLATPPAGHFWRIKPASWGDLWVQLRKPRKRLPGSWLVLEDLTDSFYSVPATTRAMLTTYAYREKTFQALGNYPPKVWGQ